jgi:hypothetical protein
LTGHAQFADELALHALGELSPADSQALLEHVRSCAECRAHLDQLTSATTLLSASTAGPMPPQRSRKRLMEAVGREPRTARFIPVRPRWWSLAPLFASAVIALFCILLLFDTARQRQRIAELKQQVEQLQASQHAMHLASALMSPDAAHFTLAMMKTKPQPILRVVYSKKQHMVVLFASNLPPIPKGKAYELWLVPMNGSAPQPAGMFMPDTKGPVMVHQNSDMEAKAFAVTVEDMAGAPAPTSPIIMAGE